jgi:hypothetical protein
MGTPADDFAGHHENTITGIVQRLRMLWRCGNVRFDHLEDKEVVLLNQRIIVHLTFEACVALGNEWRIDLRRILGRESELDEFVYCAPGRVTDPDHDV